jgi:transcriptional regulator with XRE-family HTH domain
VADELASKIREARTDAALSREQVAAALGVSLSTIVRYETGRTTRIATATLLEIAKVTQKPLSFFLGQAAA